MRQTTDTPLNETKRPLLVSCAALVLALGLGACEQTGQDQQTEAPMTQEEEQAVTGKDKPSRDQGMAGAQDKAVTGEAKKASRGDKAAQQTIAGQPPSPKFQALDTNGDGQISQKEAQANRQLSREFKKLDTDGDGQLSKADFAKLEGGKGAGAAEPSAPKGTGAGDQPPGAQENPNRPQ